MLTLTGILAIRRQKVASVLKLIFLMYVHRPVSEVCSDSDDPETGMDSDSDDRETGVGCKPDKV